MVLPSLTLTAPAKINLALHITGRRDDGYHTLESVVAFAPEVHDMLHVQRVANDALTLTIIGAFAAQLTADDSNLVLKAARALLPYRPADAGGVHITLEKRLPLGGGIGGGSADAAATMRALVQLWNMTLDAATLADIALSLGADVPVCVSGQACIMRGVGEIITPLPAALPPLYAVLVHPLHHASTPAIFQELGLEKATMLPHAALPAFDEAFLQNAATWITFLKTCRNDLTKPAMVCVPVIAEVIDTLTALPHVGHVAMSGSGATCVAYFEHERHAQFACDILRQYHSDWWVGESKIV